jgi:hypothetical protein
VRIQEQRCAQAGMIVPEFQRATVEPGYSRHEAESQSNSWCATTCIAAVKTFDHFRLLVVGDAWSVVRDNHLNDLL